MVAPKEKMTPAEKRDEEEDGDGDEGPGETLGDRVGNGGLSG